MCLASQVQAGLLAAAFVGAAEYILLRSTGIVNKVGLGLLELATI
jgi:hypothetical protein